MMQREDLFRIARTQGVSEAGVERELSNSNVVRMQRIPASLESSGRAPGQRNLWPDRIELGNRGANLGVLDTVVPEALYHPYSVLRYPG